MFLRSEMPATAAVFDLFCVRMSQTCLGNGPFESVEQEAKVLIDTSFNAISLNEDALFGVLTLQWE